MIEYWYIDYWLCAHMNVIIIQDFDCVDYFIFILQDPPNISLVCDVATKTVTLNGVQLNHNRYRRGSNALEGLHNHMKNATPSKWCGIMPWQVSFV